MRSSSFIPLPREINRKNAVVNVHNNDEFCFGYAIRSALHHGDPQSPSSYPDFKQLFNFEGIQFPVSIKDIAKFEELNKISINVYGLELVYKNGKNRYEVIGPLHFCKVRCNTHINLLMLTEQGDMTRIKSHYCYISDLSRLVSRQICSHEHRKYFCDGCLQFFTSFNILKQHMQNDCNFVRNDLPSKQLILDKFGCMVPENILKFENIQKQMKVPFIVYADFECILKPIQNDDIENVLNSYTIKKFEHIPHSFAYYIKCSFDDRISKFHLYRGADCVKKFVTDLEMDVRTLYKNYLKDIKPMTRLTESEQENFHKSTHCHICNKKFDVIFDKVKDHCHITGKFRGAAHSTCNLNFQVPQFIPVVMHNLKNYDSHLFIKSLCLDNEQIDVIPMNKEKYISFSKVLWVDSIKYKNGKVRDKYLKLRFIDSYQFLPSSLDNLSSILDNSQCLEIKKEYPNELQFKNIRKKGIFPYSYIDEFSKFDETNLPAAELFYNELRDEHISSEEYQRAKEIWKIFQCATLGDYSNIYLKSDVLLLADVFENYRALCLKTYQLDPAHYFTAPGLSWDAMLLHTRVELELLTDPDMIHFFKKGIRGGVSTCTGRKSIANNPFLENFNSLEPTKYIIYLDATNLYGYAMSQYLPQKDFVWLSQEEITDIEKVIKDISDTAETGYVLEVDLEYPKELHDAHNDLPFCPENLVPPNSKYSKLIPNLRSKEKYIIHYTYLKQCLNFGLILTKIHRAVKFTQTPWLKEYINLNTNLRNSSKNKFDRNLYKTKNNSIYGKTMENVDRRVDVKLVSHWERVGHKVNCAESLLAKPYFKDYKIFSENLVAIQMNKTKIEYNKPIYAGFSILDISKTVMYNFFYDYLKNLYGENVALLYTDTDSLILEISTDNFYNDIKNNLGEFDTSNFDKPNIHDIPQNTSAVGKFKDEFGGTPIKSFYGTGAKAYCVETNQNTIKKAKGVCRSSIEKQLTLTDYVNVIEKNSRVYCTMYTFKSHSHTMYTELMHKLALTADDDKRYLIPGSSKTLAWGHHDIQLHELCRTMMVLIEDDA